MGFAPEVVCRSSGGPVGISTLAVAVSEQPEKIEGVYEPFLIREGERGEQANGLRQNQVGFVQGRLQFVESDK